MSRKNTHTLFEDIPIQSVWCEESAKCIPSALGSTTGKQEMKANDLIKKYNFMRHPEDGLFAIEHYPYDKADRAPSGSIYYYVFPDIDTKFHVIDCDEYWVYIAGSSMQLWVIDTQGKLSVKLLGIEGDASPMYFIPKGSVFAARHEKGTEDGTFMSAITVPRYNEEDSLKLLSKEEVLAICKDAEPFWNK